MFGIVAMFSFVDGGGVEVVDDGVDEDDDLDEVDRSEDEVEYGRSVIDGNDGKQ